MCGISFVFLLVNTPFDESQMGCYAMSMEMVG